MSIILTSLLFLRRGSNNQNTLQPQDLFVMVGCFVDSIVILKIAFLRLGSCVHEPTKYGKSCISISGSWTHEPWHKNRHIEMITVLPRWGNQKFYIYILPALRPDGTNNAAADDWCKYANAITSTRRSAGTLWYFRLFFSTHQMSRWDKNEICNIAILSLLSLVV